MNSSDYWEEAVISSLEEFGVSVSEEQTAGIARDMEVAHEQYGMAFGHDVADKNLIAARAQEMADLRAEIRTERDKVTCKTCKGTGRLIVNGPAHSSESMCYKCGGAGRHSL